jgi:hypothetical protein
MVFGVNGLSILLLGLLPGTLMSVCLAAMLAYASELSDTFERPSP